MKYKKEALAASAVASARDESSPVCEVRPCGGGAAVMGKARRHWPLVSSIIGRVLDPKRG